MQVVWCTYAGNDGDVASFPARGRRYCCHSFPLFMKGLYVLEIKNTNPTLFTYTISL